jgi:hypothetical protein
MKICINLLTSVRQNVDKVKAIHKKIFKIKKLSTKQDLFTIPNKLMHNFRVKSLQLKVYS